MPANVANVPYKAAFDTVAKCEAARKPLVKPAKLSDHGNGWQCLSNLCPGPTIGASLPDARTRSSGTPGLLL
jgi:hypothetical protein